MQYINSVCHSLQEEFDDAVKTNIEDFDMEVIVHSILQTRLLTVLYMPEQNLYIVAA